MYKKIVKKRGRTYTYYYHNVREDNRIRNICLGSDLKKARIKLCQIKEESYNLLDNVPEHKVYVKVDLDLRNLDNSDVLNILIDDCSLKWSSLDQIGIFNSNANAKKGTSDSCDINCLACDNDSFDSGITSIIVNRDSLTSLKYFGEILLLEQINSEYLSNSLINELGQNNFNLYSSINFLVNEFFLNKENTILVSTTSSIYNLPSFLSLFNISFFNCSPNFKQSSSVNELLLNNSSSLCNALINFTFFDIASLATSDQFNSGIESISDFNSFGIANVSVGIFNPPITVNTINYVYIVQVYKSFVFEVNNV